MEELFKSLASGAGVAGMVLGWFLWRIEPRLKALEDAQHVSNKVDLLRLVSSPHVATEVKESATQILKEIASTQKAT